MNAIILTVYITPLCTSCRRVRFRKQEDECYIRASLGDLIEFAKKQSILRDRLSQSDLLGPVWVD